MLQRVLTVVLVSLLMSSVLIAGTNGSLVGTVKDKTTKKGIPGVQIKVIGTSRGGVTKPDGRFIIANIPAGNYTVSIKSVSHKDKTIEVLIQADKETEQNIVLEDKTITSKEVVVTGTRFIADKPKTADEVGVERTESGDKMQRSAGTLVNATQVAARQAGVVSSGGGISIRGGRSENTQTLIDGQNITDLVTAGGSGVGAAATIAGAKYAPTPSVFATQDIQVGTGNFGAGYGNTTDGYVNQTIRNGRTDMYEGFMRWVTDVPSLFGTAGNGLKAKAGLENTYEFGVGGPLPFLGKSTFFISTKYYSESNRDKGLDALDRLGNPINNIPAEGAVRNITGRMRFQLDDDIALIAGGTWGLSTLERASWGWYYATTPAMSFALNSAGTGVDTTIYSTVPENVAKQNAVNNFIGSYYLRLNHTLSETTYYEFTLSNNFNITEDARRKLPLGAGSLLVNGNIQDPSKVTTSAPGANFFKGYDLYYPEDNMVLTSNQSQMIARGTSPRDKTIDIYTPTRGRVYKIGNTIYTNNFFSPSNLTGYVEGPEDLSGTNNAYGLSNVFTARGNLDDARGRGFDFRMSSYFEAKGDYETRFQSSTEGGVTHKLKTGFDASYFTIERYNNSLPWLGSPFYDVYTSQWGGDIYSDVASESEEGSRARHPWTLALYAEDQISYMGIHINPSLRLDIYNPSTLYRIDPVLREGTRQSASIKIQPSPRIFISYPLNEKGTNFFSIAYGVYTQTPKFSLLYDNTVAAVNRGNVLVGNPDLRPERTNQYNVSYNTAISEEFTFDVSAFYKDVYGLTGVTYIPDSRYPYSLYSNGEYGNSRGVEFSLRKRLSNNFEFNVNYTLAYSQGTSSGVGTNYSFVVLSGVDQYTEKKTFPLTEYALDYDRRHRVNAILNLVWGTDEGPSIGGMKFLQNTTISFNGLFQTGTPYTLLDLKGNQAGDYNAERQPSFWNIDARIERNIPLKDIFGESLGTSTLSIFVDIINMFNRTEPFRLYDRTRDPDNDGVNLYRLPGEFPQGPWYAVEDPNVPRSLDPDQYDNVGNRLYNKNADANNDGMVTQDEEYRSFLNYVNDSIQRRGNYQYPRQVFFGVALRF